MLAAWSSAALRGEVSAERAMDVLGAERLRVVFLDEESDPSPFLTALGRWRSSGIPGWRYVPVAPGDGPSLPGPSTFAARALEAGVALVATAGSRVGLVPLRGEDTLTWISLATDGPGSAPVETVSEAERLLLEAVTTSIEQLDALEVADWRSEVESLLTSWHAADPTPPGWPERADRLAARSLRLLELAELALQDAGGSRTSAETLARATVLRELVRAARAAHAVAWNEGLRGGATARPWR